LNRSQKRQRAPEMTLDRIRWKEEHYFRSLSYYFSVRWNNEALGAQVLHLLGDFSVPRDPDEENPIWAPGLPPRYSLEKRSSGESRYYLLYGESIMAQGNLLHPIMTRLIWHVHTHSVRITGDFLLIHAGSVTTPAGEGVLLPAPSGNGKTTLTTALVRAGFRYLSDEAGAIDPVTRRLYPFQRPLILKEGHAQVFPDLYRIGNGSTRKGMRHLRPELIRQEPKGEPCEIRFVIAHKYQPGARTTITPISKAEALMELVNNVSNLHRYRGRALPLLAPVARRARSYRLVQGNVDEAVEAITAVTKRRRRAAARVG
jgi:hypothetical protein